MNLDSLLPKVPLIASWIDDTLTSHKNAAQSVASLGFARLPAFYSNGLLAIANVVPVDRVPVPPLSSIGLPEFTEFEHGNYAGITFKDTYFVKQPAFRDESLHFHELVHVVQWSHLGVERFLLAYASGLVISITWNRSKLRQRLADRTYRAISPVKDLIGGHNLASRMAKSTKELRSENAIVFNRLQRPACHYRPAGKLQHFLTQIVNRGHREPFVAFSRQTTTLHQRTPKT